MKKLIFSVTMLIICISINAEFAKIINITTAGTLAANSDIIGLKDRITKLTVTGTINQVDLTTIKNMISSNVLTDVILSSASIVECTNNGTTYPANVFPNSIFFNSRLKTMILPTNLVSIDDYAFNSCKNLTSITIPNSVTNLGSNVFYDCIALTSATLPNNITKIKTGTFSNCSALVAITIPNSVEIIENSAFLNCNALKNIDIPSFITYIGLYNFNNCSGIIKFTVDPANNYFSSSNDVLFNKNKTKLISYPRLKIGSTYTIPNTVDTIDNQAFQYTTLTSITIPSSVISINNYAFANTSFATITIPNSVKAIKANAFFNNKSLTTITIPDSIKMIEAGTFSLCDKLTSVVFSNPNTLKTIGENAFSGCIGLTSLTIPNSVTEIGAYAFYFNSFSSISIPNSVTTIKTGTFMACKYLASITIPNSVTSIETDAFNNCTALKTIKAEMTTLPTLGSTIFTGVTPSCLLLVPFNLIDTYKNEQQWSLFYSNTQAGIFEKNCTPNEFYSMTINKSYIYKIKITGSINQKDLTAIRGSTYLSYVDISAVTIAAYTTYPANSIPMEGFYSLPNLSTIILPNSIVGIGNSAFCSCQNLKTITIPNSVTSIGNDAFSGCSGLISLETKMTTLPTMGTNVFKNIPTNTCKLIVPVGKYNNYSTADQWKSFTNVYDLGTKTINCTAGELSNLLDTNIASATKLIITGSIDKRDIETMNLMLKNNALTSIDISGANIIEYADNGITYPANTIPSQSYYGCVNLASFTMPNSTTTIENNAFAGCINLKAINFPSSTTTIGDKAFSACESLTSISIPNTITAIGNEAFSGCNNLVSFTVVANNPNYSSLNGVLFDKNKLNIINYPIKKQGSNYSIPNTVTTIANNAFNNCGSLTSIVIPSSVTFIGEKAFNNCLKLDTILSYTPNSTLGTNAFNGISPTAKTYCPEGKKQDYTNSGYPNIIEFAVSLPQSIPNLNVSASNNNKITIASNTKWTAESNQSWLSTTNLGKFNGELTISATANNSATARQATITVKADGVSNKTIEIIQDGITLSTSSDSVKTSASAKEKLLLKVTSNSSWDLSPASQNWIKLSKIGDSLKFVFEENTSISSRYATANISVGNIVSKTVFIKQEAGETKLSLSSDSLKISESSKDTLIAIESNTDWTVDCSEYSWLNASPNGSLNGNITLTIEANYSNQSRTGIITVKASGIADKKITIVQNGATATKIYENKNLNTFKLYPNPAVDKIYVDINEGSEVSLYNQLGQKVLNTKVYNNCISVSDIPRGLYILRTGNKQQKVMLK